MRFKIVIGVLCVLSVLSCGSSHDKSSGNSSANGEKSAQSAEQPEVTVKAITEKENIPLHVKPRRNTEIRERLPKGQDIDINGKTKAKQKISGTWNPWYRVTYKGKQLWAYGDGIRIENSNKEIPFIEESPFYVPPKTKDHNLPSCTIDDTIGQKYMAAQNIEIKTSPSAEADTRDMLKTGEVITARDFYGSWNWNNNNLNYWIKAEYNNTVTGWIPRDAVILMPVEAISTSNNAEKDQVFWPVYKKPAESSSEVDQVAVGSHIGEIIDAKTISEGENPVRWYQIQLQEGKTGWIQGANIEPLYNQTRLMRLLEVIRSEMTGRTPKDIRNNLGEPEVFTRTAVENRHDSSVTDYILDYGYPGLEVSYYHATSVEKYIVLYVEIHEFPDKMPYGLAGGLSETALMQLFGRPRAKDGNKIHYFTGGLHTPQLRMFFTMGNGTVKGLGWQGYID